MSTLSIAQSERSKVSRAIAEELASVQTNVNQSQYATGGSVGPAPAKVSVGSKLMLAMRVEEMVFKSSETREEYDKKIKKRLGKVKTDYVKSASSTPPPPPSQPAKQEIVVKNEVKQVRQEQSFVPVPSHSSTLTAAKFTKIKEKEAIERDFKYRLGQETEAAKLNREAKERARGLAKGSLLIANTTASDEAKINLVVKKVEALERKWLRPLKLSTSSLSPRPSKRQKRSIKTSASKTGITFDVRCSLFEAMPMGGFMIEEGKGRIVLKFGGEYDLPVKVEKNDDDNDDDDDEKENEKDRVITSAAFTITVNLVPLFCIVCVSPTGVHETTSIESSNHESADGGFWKNVVDIVDPVIENLSIASSNDTSEMSCLIASAYVSAYLRKCFTDYEEEGEALIGFVKGCRSNYT